MVANEIRKGSIAIVIAGGAESMTAAGKRPPPKFSEKVVNASQEAADCLQHMGQTSENVGKDFNITREAQDKWAEISFQRAEKSQRLGWFDDEILPINTIFVDPKTGEKKNVTISKD